ncbi:MAG: 4Fe-4S binding protein [Candidatus Tectomicrobia bacterium]|uniref:4Fe-4S binding protein n=1 Tax=Tectimicrobiota bacterium TaxID=2528274 RepID=A0A932FWL8_UNCTE|nr:4Fe-4S binding protein [Candidatus Tectomicrobia bacterium]
MRVLTGKVKALAKEWGADLVGVAPIERLTDSPAPWEPGSLLPQTRTLLSLGIRINRTVQAVHLLDRSDLPFSRFACSAPDDRLDQIAAQVSNFLEDMGHDACPLPASEPLSQWIHGGALFSHRYAAIAAGLGQPGWSSNLITLEAGAGIRLSTVLTSAELIPDPLPREELCHRCMACVKACPAGAISLQEAVPVRVGGLTYFCASRSLPRCLWGCSGLPLPPPELPEETSLPQALGLLSEALSSRASLPVPLDFSRCGRCQAICYPRRP